MVAAWPSNLPQFSLREGYEEGFGAAVVRSATDTGIPKRRRRFTAVPSTLTEVIEVTSAELDIFITFYETTLAFGALSFTKDHPRTGVSETFSFREDPPPAVPAGATTFIVILPLDKAS